MADQNSLNGTRDAAQQKNAADAIKAATAAVEHAAPAAGAAKAPEATARTSDEIADRLSKTDAAKPVVALPPAAPIVPDASSPAPKLAGKKAPKGVVKKAAEKGATKKGATKTGSVKTPALAKTASASPAGSSSARPVASKPVASKPVASKPSVAKPAGASSAPPADRKIADKPEIAAARKIETAKPSKTAGAVGATKPVPARQRPGTVPVAEAARTTVAAAEAAADDLRQTTVKVADRVQTDTYEAIDRAETAFSQGPVNAFTSSMASMGSPFASVDPFAFLPTGLRQASETAARTLSDTMNVARRSGQTATEAVEESYEATSAVMLRGRERAMGLARSQGTAGYDLMRDMVSATGPGAVLDAQRRFAAAQAKLVAEATAETVADMRGLMSR